MISSLLNIARVPDLWRKCLVTLGLIGVYRLGAHIPTPFINSAEVEKFFQSSMGGGQGIFAVVDMFSGGAFKQMTVFALGIMPYISASIIIQLLTAIWPRLEKIAKEGEAGRRKITQWTRYGTVLLALFQGFGLGVYLLQSKLTLLANHPLAFMLITAITMCTGTCFLMWLGEKISQHGIGNGISLIITVGILAAYPTYFAICWEMIKNQSMTPMAFISVLVLMVLVSALIVISIVANRNVPVQHARRMVGRRMMQGGKTVIPLKLNTAGVIPVIFASAILTFPVTMLPSMGRIGDGLFSWIQNNSIHNVYNFLQLGEGGIFNLLKSINLYTLLFTLLTFFFCFFYTAITLNPADLAENLKKSGAFVPGIKPGKHTADFIDHILVRITVVGALFLIVVSLVPEFLFASYNIPYSVAQMTGGTGLIIVVGVLLDTMKQIESQLMMRHYEGFTLWGGGSGAGRGRARRPSFRLRPQDRG